MQSGNSTKTYRVLASKEVSRGKGIQEAFYLNEWNPRKKKKYRNKDLLPFL